MDLPIDEHLDEVVAAVREHGAVVLVAPPGAGKTTRVPPALAADGKTILLQPRRIAARALARRIAEERNWSLGREVGWQVRFDRRFSRDTQLLVVTEGILTVKLRDDPLLNDYRTVVIDEFHERSLHADLALALTRQARLARGDLRVVVMSATLDASPISRFLGNCPIIEISGRTHPVEIEYAPDLSVTDAVLRRLPKARGHLLCFLPGAPEIGRVMDGLRKSLPTSESFDLLPLHGSLSADRQDEALRDSGRRKIIVATNIAETSLTVDGITDVIDGGLHKVLRRDSGVGFDRLETERVSRDSAEQRAGRAGRTGPGHVLRLWNSSDELRPHREPEIQRVDLASAFLEILAWGGDPTGFDWFETPPEESTTRTLALLKDLGATRDGRLTESGHALQRLPLHPRLARLLLGDGGSERAAAACATLSERWSGSMRGETTDSDLLSLADRIHEAPFHVRRVYEFVRGLARRLTSHDPANPKPNDDPDVRFRRAVFDAYSDRVAQRRAPRSRRVRMASGHGAILMPGSGVRDGEFLVAVDIIAGRRGPGSEARIRLASRVERSWLAPTHDEILHEFDPDSEIVRAFELQFHHALVLVRRPIDPDPEIAGDILAREWLNRAPDPATSQLLRRLQFAGLEPDLPSLLSAACTGRVRLPTIRLSSLLPFEVRRDLDRIAPETIGVASGRKVSLVYREDGQIVAAVKLQEMFGQAESPRVGPDRTPVTLSLLAPNGRPVQTTRDLRSFWDGAYAEVRKELRGRYPKHPWPVDPWTARPTARTKPRRG